MAAEQAAIPAAQAEARRVRVRAVVEAVLHAALSKFPMTSRPSFNRNLLSKISVRPRPRAAWRARSLQLRRRAVGYRAR